MRYVELRDWESSMRDGAPFATTSARAESTIVQNCWPSFCVRLLANQDFCIIRIDVHTDEVSAKRRWGTFWKPLGSLLGASWVPLGGLLGPLGGFLEASWGVLGAFRGVLGASLGPLGAS